VTKEITDENTQLNKYEGRKKRGYKWIKCECADVQTMRHIVDTCRLSRFVDGALSRLNSADDCAIAWLQSAAVKAFAN